MREEFICPVNNNDNSNNNNNNNSNNNNNNINNIKSHILYNNHNPRADFVFSVNAHVQNIVAHLSISFCF